MKVVPLLPGPVVGHAAVAADGVELVQLDTVTEDDSVVMEMAGVLGMTVVDTELELTRVEVAGVVEPTDVTVPELLTAVEVTELDTTEDGEVEGVLDTG